jgi:biotin carboxyl carrier protein
MKYQASAQEKTLLLEKKQGKFYLNNQLLDVVLHGSDESELVLGIGQNVYRVHVHSFVEDGRVLLAKINGRHSRITLKNQTDLLLEKMGFAGNTSTGSGKVKAPMPGLIVKVMVSVGDRVEKNQVLLNFEAMKMENQLKSPASGEVKELLVLQGEKIEKGQILVVIA